MNNLIITLSLIKDGDDYILLKSDLHISCSDCKLYRCKNQ